MTIDEIKAAIDSAVAEAYLRGFEDGKTEVSKSIAAVMASVTASPSAIPKQPESQIVEIPTSTDSSPEKSGVDSEFNREDHAPDDSAHIKRAPKGLTEHVLQQVMANSIDLTMDEIQRRAVAYDGRVSPKTIYNDLRRRDHLYQRVGHDRWKLRSSPDSFDALLDSTDAPEERAGQEAPTATV